MRKMAAALTAALAMAVIMQSCRSYDARMSSDAEFLEERDSYVPWWAGD